MKPDFALDFRDNQIALLHRQETGWAIIGRVAMDDPDLDAAMAYLRATALGLSPRGVAAKLILPNEAILYTELSSLPYGHEQRAAAIKQGLIGRTPYGVDDLVYDWTDAGASAHVAVIARETLDEAEGFASQHRFNPISFAALPNQSGYDGEVWFGATQLSETLLAQGEVIERDDVTLLAVDADVAPKAELAASDFEMGAALDADPLDEPFAQAEADHPPSGARNAQKDPSPAPQQDNREVLQDFMTVDPVVQEGVANVASLEPDQASSPGLEPKVEQAYEPDLGTQPEALRQANSDNQQTPPASFEAAFAETPEPSGLAASADVEEAPMAVDVPLIDDLPAPDKFGEKPQTRAEKMLAAFSARRDAALSKAEAETNARRVEPVLRVAKADDLQTSLPLDQVPAYAAADLAAPSLLAAEMQAPQSSAPIAKPADPAPQPTSPLLVLPKLGVPEAKLGRAPEVAATSGLRPAIVKHVPAKQQQQKPQDLKSMPQAKARPRLGMRLGWILTIILLLALAAAGALSEYMLTSYNVLFSKQTELVAVEPAQEPEPEPAQNALTTQIAAPATLATPISPVEDLPATEKVAKVAAAQNPAPIAPAAVALAQTMPTSPPPDLTLPTLFGVASAQGARPNAIADPTLGETSALAAANAALPAPLPRPPEVTRTATTSASVLVLAGKPALVPSPRPDLILAAAGALRPATAQTAPDLSAPPVADPSLAGAKPLPRPASIVAAAKAAAPAPSLGPPPAADPVLADARPTKRPDNILSAGRAARLASAPASLVAGAEAAIAEAALAPAPLAADPNLSPLAVSVSRIPAPRPAGLKSAFDQALAAAAALDPVPEASPPAEEVASNVAPVDESAEQDVGLDGGAAERSVVAKQATQRNMLNLQNTNLVGIFGSQANRYALIRQPSGSFKRLKVGDRFDGGRIAAITESEVRYEKGGDLLALRMPKI
jgi:hypothetical protein